MSKSAFVSLRLPCLLDLPSRMHTKYAVTLADAELAVDYVRCFFDAKARHPGQLIILPQIADWAWHELIVDTVQYRRVCSQVFGRLLSHVREDPDQNPSRNLRAAYLRSMETMRKTYALGTGEHWEDWLDPGWDRPQYRLRSYVNFDCAIPEALSTYVGGFDAVEDRLMSWLPRRLVERFNLTDAGAIQYVMQYIDYLRSKRRSGGRSEHCEESMVDSIAWQEHILWTDRYAEDCDLLFGHFLDRASDYRDPRSPRSLKLDHLTSSLGRNLCAIAAQ
jgi:hypothetical protein